MQRQGLDLVIGSIASIEDIGAGSIRNPSSAFVVEIDHLHPKFAFVRLAKKAPRKQPRGRGLSTVAMSGAENAALAMVEAAYRHHGLNWRCINCEVPLALFGDAVR